MTQQRPSMGLAHHLCAMTCPGLNSEHSQEELREPLVCQCTGQGWVSSWQPIEAYSCITNRADYQSSSGQGVTRDPSERKVQTVGGDRMSSTSFLPRVQAVQGSENKYIWPHGWGLGRSCTESLGYPMRTQFYTFSAKLKPESMGPRRHRRLGPETLGVSPERNMVWV